MIFQVVFSFDLFHKDIFFGSLYECLIGKGSLVCFNFDNVLEGDIIKDEVASEWFRSYSLL
jgi:hypothetical protein